MEDRKLVTKFLADKHIDVVLSSPFKRAVDTVKDFATFAKMQWSDFAYKLSDGECLQEVQTRNISALQQVIYKYAGKNIVVGSHGTALSTIINYYDHSFGYNDFERIKNVMPWIVEFVFDENTKCIGIEEHDLSS